MSKKFSFISILLVSVLLLTACGPKPEDSVDTFFKGMQEFDFDKMISVVYSTEENDSDTDIEDLAEDDLYTENIMEYLEEKAKKIEYEIKDTEINGDEAKVKVYAKYVDGSNILTNTISKFMEEVLTLAFSGQDLDDDRADELSNSIFMEEVEKGEDRFTERELELDLVKKDGKWLIKDPSDKVLDVVLANFASTINALDEEYDDDGELDLDDEEVVELKKGETVKLATIEVKVDSLEEKEVLVNAFDDETPANEGAKFVVLNLSIKNTTKSPLDIGPEGFVLLDDEGRTYDVYGDNIMAVDNYMDYREIGPGITEQGVFSYQVPEDAKGFYLLMGHADTNEVMKLEIGE